MSYTQKQPPEVFHKKAVLKTFTIFIGKHLCRSIFSLHKKWSFLLRISSVKVFRAAGNCGFGHIYLRNPNEKFHFLYSAFYKVADLQVFVYNSKWFGLRIHWSLLTIFCKKVYIFWEYICSESLFNAINIEIKHKKCLKKFPSDKRNVMKMHFLSFASSNSSKFHFYL